MFDHVHNQFPTSWNKGVIIQRNYCANNNDVNNNESINMRTTNFIDTYVHY